MCLFRTHDLFDDDITHGSLSKLEQMPTRVIFCTLTPLRRSSKACKNKNGGAKNFGFTSPQQRKSSLEPPKFQRSLEPPKLQRSLEPSLVRATSSVSLTSSDSGISMSSSPPSFEEARSAASVVSATKLELPDPLLGGGGGGSNGFCGAGGDSRDGVE